VTSDEVPTRWAVGVTVISRDVDVMTAKGEASLPTVTVVMSALSLGSRFEDVAYATKVDEGFAFILTPPLAQTLLAALQDAVDRLPPTATGG